MAALRLTETDSSGLLRRAGRAVLGSAAILIVGAGAVPAATGAASGLRLVTAHHATTQASGVSPSALPAESRTPAARFVVGEDGTLSRVR